MKHLKCKWRVTGRDNNRRAIQSNDGFCIAHIIRCLPSDKEGFKTAQHIVDLHNAAIDEAERKANPLPEDWKDASAHPPPLSGKSIMSERASVDGMAIERTFEPNQSADILLEAYRITLRHIEDLNALNAKHDKITTTSSAESKADRILTAIIEASHTP